MNSDGLKKSYKVVGREVTIWTTVSLANTGTSVTEDFLAGVRRISSTSTVGVATNITVGMADVVLVSRVEFVVGKTSEGLAPEDDTVFQRQTDTLQK